MGSEENARMGVRSEEEGRFPADRSHGEENQDQHTYSYMRSPSRSPSGSASSSRFGTASASSGAHAVTTRDLSREPNTRSSGSSVQSTPGSGTADSRTVSEARVDRNQTRPGEQQQQQQFLVPRAIFNFWDRFRNSGVR